MRDDDPWIQRLADRYQALPRPHRWLPLAYAIVVVGLAGPWLTGRSFTVLGEPETVTLQGFEAATPLAFLAVVGLAGVLFAETDALRSSISLVVFGATLAWTTAFLVVGFHLGCFMCSDVEPLWGVTVAAVGSALGAVLTLAGVDWTAAKQWLETRQAG